MEREDARQYHCIIINEALNFHASGMVFYGSFGWYGCRPSISCLIYPSMSLIVHPDIFGLLFAFSVLSSFAIYCSLQK
jgi:hypothetical protein